MIRMEFQETLDGVAQGRKHWLDVSRCCGSGMCSSETRHSISHKRTQSKEAGEVFAKVLSFSGVETSFSTVAAVEEQTLD